MSNYGGKRPNSGRKPHPMGETVVKRVPKGLIPIVDTLIKTHQKPFNGVIKTLACMPLDVQHIDPKADAIQIPLALEHIPAGFASPAEGYAEDYIDLNEYLVRNRSATIIVRCGGDSMLDAGIAKGDLLVIDRSVTPGHRDIVMADLGAQYTIKRLHFLKQGGVELHSENSSSQANYPNYTFGEGDELAIVGVVMHVLKDMRVKH
ncbi:LexA family protein [Moraxella catarrhalis]|uniref:Error-prone repair protein UmuD n=1 Tax=Moraxella catarrhalis TaxID=480 RepID=A0A198UMI3_MORCA|nr:translesion error-prone DNA polymerase V autoproteolytic subunit [Moraxella catarrhalis]OAU96447.1 Error-prone repair protein UmuD [Moraxella catarrhalis]OAU96901.1 Error-prone repair protein UmuD [Moraxella catarrhalis]OAV03287.1 Error-prone repair protein UmuD [Moraxella catarrhalis]